MKKIITSMCLAFTLVGHMAFAETTTNFYQGKSEIGLTYYATGWSDTRYNCELGTAIVYGIFTLGIGPIGDCLQSAKQKEEVVNADLNAILNQVENGRAMIKLSSGGENNCAGFSSTLFAEEDGFGGYSLYASKEDWTSGKTMGTAIKYAKGLELTFTGESLNIGTAGKDGRQCLWQLGNHFNAKLALKSQND